jgi:Radical SAM superfamily/4Fe-4S single cluster domain
MKMNNTWHLPWTADNVPHGVLDINRGCNITCRACYNEAAPHHKSLEEITNDLDVMTKLRRIDSLSLAGGEVTLHPQLLEIIKLIKRRGITVELFTNGLLLDEVLLDQLSAAGTDLIFLHIEPSQQRDDLPASPSFEDCRQLIEQKTAQIHVRGMESGVVFTACDDQELPLFVDLVINIPTITYMLVTLCRENSQINWVKGDVLAGMQGKSGPANATPDVPQIDSVAKWFREQHQARPFARICSNVDKTETRWLSYLMGVVDLPTGNRHYSACRSGLLEKSYLKIYYWLKRRYPFYTRQDSRQFRLQLLLNAISGGCFFGNMKLLFHSLRPQAKLKALRILLQKPAEVASDGTVIHCLNCPDATIKNGRLVPLCLVDKVRENQ